MPNFESQSKPPEGLVWDSALGRPSPSHMQPPHVQEWLANNDHRFETITGREVQHIASKYREQNPSGDNGDACVDQSNNQSGYVDPWYL